MTRCYLVSRPRVLWTCVLSALRHFVPRRGRLRSRNLLHMCDWLSFTGAKPAYIICGLAAIVLMPQQHGSRVDCSKSHVPVILSFRSSTWAPYMHHPQCAKRCAAKLGCFTMHARPFCFLFVFQRCMFHYSTQTCIVCFFVKKKKKKKQTKSLRVLHNAQDAAAGQPEPLASDPAKRQGSFFDPDAPAQHMLCVRPS